MIITKGDERLAILTVIPSLEEGDYDSVIREVNFLNDCKTNYGFKDFIEVEYGIKIGITEQSKKEKIMISQSENSRCYKFLLEIYKGNIPMQIDINDFIGKKCTLTIKHNADEKGNVYANIVERKFS
ncbi:hypothetical protein JW813_06830 [Clostridium botulinum]|uniref:hypothetical protein n=1 Tax=Clostridium botulinum TaxID=1491 RepID=UPI0022453744|nr:hypothetical protein [Clostridium botulinum]UZP04719.1 hypothetical protein JW813_06830 [Clostridium botulinum]UZP08131.1 hypothetical protein JYA71_07105 [Clostridium botulinum]UZP11458.1 hypothetical protein JYA74_06825 [Clostridium botulinum]